MIESAFSATDAKMFTIAGGTEKELCCTQCSHLHNRLERLRVTGWEEQKEHTECPACGAHSFYDLAEIRGKNPFEIPTP